MIKVYAVALAAGFIAIVVLVYGGLLSENLGRPARDPGRRLGKRGKMAVGAVTGFGMAGMSAEFSPFDLSWPVALLIALVGAAASALWVRFSTKEDGE